MGLISAGYSEQMWCMSAESVYKQTYELIAVLVKQSDLETMK